MKDLRSRWNLLVLLLAISSTLGCTALAAGPHQASSESQNLEASSATVDFGTIVAGNTSAVTNYISNPTSSKISITRVAVSDANFQVSSRSMPIILYPNQGTRLVISYNPHDSGNSSGTLIISTSSTQHAMTVPLTGSAIPAGKLVVSPSSMGFGNVTVGKSLSKSGTFTNSGATTVTVSQAAASTTDYNLTGVSFPVVLQPHQSANFSVVFTPKSAGSRSGNISVGGTASLVAPNAPTAHRHVYVAHVDSQSETVTLAVSGVGMAVKSSDTTLGQVTSNPGSLSFGSSQVGSTQNKPLVFTNSGTASITISQVAATGSGYTVKGPNLPLTLAGNQSASFTVTFAPQAAGTANGNIAVASNALNTSLNVGLTATVASKGLLGVSANPVSFGTVQVGNTQKASATIQNTGGSPVTVSQVLVSGTAFSMNTMGMPMTLAPNQSMQVSVTCAPKSSGALAGSLSVTSDASNSNLSVPLTGTAVMAGALTVTPSSLSFGSVQTGKTQSKSVSLTNSGGASVTVTQASFSGSGYSVSGLNLPLTLQAGNSASFNVVFAPQSITASNSSLSIASSDATNPTTTIALSGTGMSGGALTAGSSSLSFGNVTVGNSSTLPETITNSGGTSVTLTAVAAGAGYSVTGLSLPTTLAAGQSASFSVMFSPQSTGKSSVNLAVTNDSTAPTFSIPLSGTGVSQGALTISPVTFGSVQVGNSSTQQATLTNSGGSSVTVSQATLTGTAFATTGLATPLTLSAGQSLTFSVIFTPQSTGTATGGIAFTSNAASSPTLSLSGTGAAAGQFSVSPGTFGFGSVAVGSSKTMTATLSATGSSVTVTSASVNSNEFSITGPSLPLTIQPGNNVSFTLTFTPQASGAATGSVSFASSASPFSGSLTGSGTAAVQHSVTLSWNPSSSDVSGYNVYRSSLAAGPFTKLNSGIDADTTYTDNSVQAGQNYFYVTTALDTTGTESTYSNQVSAAIPTP